MSNDLRTQIEAALGVFGSDSLKTAAIGLLNTLGRHSEKTPEIIGQSLYCNKAGNE